MDQAGADGQARVDAELPRVRAAGRWLPEEAIGDLRDLRRDVHELRHLQERERERDRELRGDRHVERQAFLPVGPQPQPQVAALPDQVEPDYRAAPRPRNNKVR